jgi:hypothetical protein
MGDMGNEHNILAGKFEGMDYLGDQTRALVGG